jgi:hypothetical protein
VQFELAAEGYRQHGPLPARIAHFEETRLHAHDFESDCGRLKLSTPQRAIQTFCNKARFNRMGLYDAARIPSTPANATNMDRESTNDFLESF